MLKYLIFDVDHTLLEFDDDEKRAFYNAFKERGIILDKKQLSDLRDFSYVGWAKLGLNDVHDELIQKNYHELYKRYVYEMFDEISSKVDFGIDSSIVADSFLLHLAKRGHPIGNCEKVLKTLSEKYRICIATNGLHAVQTGRLTAFSDIYKIFISEKIGHIKPEREFFDFMLEELSAERDECLMIGDSLSSDIAGAKSSGMKSCWFNRFKKINESGVIPDYEIKNIDELLDIL